MISVHDLLYLVLSLGALVVTGVVLAVGIQLMRVLGEFERTTQNIEQITSLLERISRVAFPGIERVAKSTDRAAGKLADSIDKLTK
jgi:hypothetical protein